MDQGGLAAWLSFDTDEKTIEIKYLNEEETTFFDYTLLDDVFRARHKDGEEEVMIVKSGSVFENHFKLIQTDGMDITVFNLTSRVTSNYHRR